MGGEGEQTCLGGVSHLSLPPYLVVFTTPSAPPSAINPSQTICTACCDTWKASTGCWAANTADVFTAKVKKEEPKEVGREEVGCLMASICA